MRKKPSELTRTSLTPDQQELAQNYLPLARSLAKTAKQNWPEQRDEFESAACLALVQAAEAFDPSHKAQFATFARYRILGAIRDVQRRMSCKCWKNDPLVADPTFIPLSPESEQYGRTLNSEPDPPVGSLLEAEENFEVMLRRLPPTHATMCREIYGNNRTQNEVARQLGYSPSRVSVMHQEALAWISRAHHEQLACDNAPAWNP